MVFSQSLASLRHRPNHANVRSTTHLSDFLIEIVSHSEYAAKRGWKVVSAKQFRPQSDEICFKWLWLDSYQAGIVNDRYRSGPNCDDFQFADRDNVRAARCESRSSFSWNNSDYVLKLIEVHQIRTQMTTLADYFKYWSQPAREHDRGIDRGSFIQPYFTNQHVLSLALNIPVDWTQLYLPGQPPSGKQVTPQTLPFPLKFTIRKLGFTAEKRGAVALGSRRYKLRPHSFPLSITLYETRILPHLGSRDAFEGAFEHAQFLYELDMQHLEFLEATDPAAYVQQLLQLDYWLV